MDEILTTKETLVMIGTFITIIVALVYMLKGDNGARQKIEVYGKEYIVKTFVFRRGRLVKSWRFVTEDNKEFQEYWQPKLKEAKELYKKIIEEEKNA